MSDDKTPPPDPEPQAAATNGADGTPAPGPAAPVGSATVGAGSTQTLEGAPAGVPNRVRWDDSRMSSSYANVVNVLATREEVTLLFGTNQTWNAIGSDELVVQLSDRIVLTPYAAKRLSVLLNRRVAEYESRFGKLDL